MDTIGVTNDLCSRFTSPGGLVEGRSICGPPLGEGGIRLLLYGRNSNWNKGHVPGFIRILRLTTKELPATLS